MGRFLLLIVGAVGLGTVLVLFRSAAPATAAAEGVLWERADEAVAREVALTGLGDAEARLSEAFAVAHGYDGPTAWTGAYAGGSYEVAVAYEDSLLVVTTRGAFGDAEHHVRRAYRPRAHEGPPFVRQALLVDRNIQIRHPLVATAPAPGNANVHANQHLQLHDPTVLVTGFGTASGQIQPHGGVALPAVFVPNWNPGGLAPYADGVAPVDVPPVGAASYRPLASAVLPRNHALGGRVPLGTREAPAVLFAEGALRTGADVEFDGWGVLVVDGNFTIDHALRTVGDADRSRLLVLVEGVAHVRRDDVDLAGSWVVGGNLLLRQGSRLVDGGFTVGGHFQSAGAVEIRFLDVPIELVDLAWPDHLVDRSYREW